MTPRQQRNNFIWALLYTILSIGFLLLGDNFSSILLGMAAVIALVQILRSIRA